MDIWNYSYSNERPYVPTFLLFMYGHFNRIVDSIWSMVTKYLASNHHSHAYYVRRPMGAGVLDKLGALGTT